MDLNKYTVLLVDDMDVIRRITSDQLRRFGVGHVKQADNGMQALAYLRERQVDLIISDWEMPKMDGLELLKAIRSNPKLKHIPFIMTPADAEREQMVMAIKAGVTDLMIKPFTVGMLRQRVTSALKGGRLTDRLAAAKDNENNNKKARQSVLVVDDSSDNLTLIGGLLKQDYDVKLVKSGEKALAIVQGDIPPDLVLLDVMMPGLSGFEVIEKMRAHPQSQHIPVIFITALTDMESNLQGLKGGAVDYVTKPIQPELLKLRIANLMRYMARHKSLQADYDDLKEKQRLQESVETILNNDLKGPIGALIATVKTMHNEHLTPKESKYNLEQLDNLTQQLSYMVTLSSELIKIETGRFVHQPQAFSIHDTLKRIVTLMQKTFAEKNQVIFLEPFEEEPEHPFTVNADPILCYSLFFNLIKNACEAAPDKTRVSITLSLTTPLAVRVQNIGAVDSTIRNRFWDKGVTTHTATGAGLGTYSAKLLAEVQGLDIDMQVNDEKNLTNVTVTFE